MKRRIQRSNILNSDQRHAQVVKHNILVTHVFIILIYIHTLCLGYTLQKPELYCNNVRKEICNVAMMHVYMYNYKTTW